MATTKIYTIQIDGIEQDVKNIEELEGAVKSLNDQMNKATFGSEQFEQLREETAKAQKALEEVQDEISNVSSVQKADALKKLGESLAGGFAVATVALDAFGVSGKTLQEAQTRAVQLIAALDGIKKITEGLSSENLKFAKAAFDSFKKAGLGATLFGNTTRAALTATGIGLFIVALGTIITYWDDIKVAVGLADAEQSKYFENAIKNTEKLKELQQQSNTELEARLQLLKLTGAAESEITTQRIINSNKAIKALQDERKIYEEQVNLLANLEKKFKDGTLTAEEFAKAQELIKDSDIPTALAAATTKYNELSKSIVNASNQQRILNATLTNNLKDENDKQVADNKAKNDKIKSENEKAAQEQLKAQRNIEDLQLARREEGFDKQIAAIRLRTKREIQDLQGSSEQIQKQRELLLERQNEEISKILDQKRFQEIVKKFNAPFVPPSPDQIAASMQAAIQARNAALENAPQPNVRSVFDILFGTNTGGLTDSDDQAKADAVRSLADTGVQVFFETLDIMTQFIDDRIQNERDKIDSLETEAQNSLNRINSLEEQLNGASLARRAEIIGQIQSEKAKEQQLAAEKKKLADQLAKDEKKRAQIQKISDIAQAVGSTAKGVVNALATSGPPWVGIVMAALIGALGAAQIALISKQQYDTGGHTTGLGFTDSSGHEVAGTVHANEYVVPKYVKETKRGSALVDALESMRLGKPGYAEGGPVTPPGVVTTAVRSQTIDGATLVQQLSQLQLKVDVTEIASVGSRSALIEENASI